jgi:hypothetical protein
MDEKGPDLRRRNLLKGAAALGALTALGVTVAGAQEATQESKIPTADRIDRLTTAAALAAKDAKDKGESILNDLRKRIFGGQDPAAGKTTFAQEERHLLTGLQKNVQEAYESFISQSDAYFGVMLTAIRAQDAHQAVVDQVEEERKAREKSGSTPVAIPASLTELSLTDNARANAERMREIALTLARANDALLDSAKK